MTRGGWSRWSDALGLARAARAGLRLTALCLAALLLVVACKSKELEAVDQAEAAVAAIDWNDGRDVADKLRTLAALDTALQQLPAGKDRQARRAAGDRALTSAIAVGLVRPVIAQLEKELRMDVGLGQRGFDALKTYLLLGSPARAKEHAGWLTLELSSRAAGLHGPASKLPAKQLQTELGKVVMRYTMALADGEVEAEALDADLVEQVRKIRRMVAGSDRLWELIVDKLAAERIDPGGPATDENLRFPPLSLATLFADRREVLAVLHSKRFDREAVWQQVDGVYTAAGYQAVHKAAADRLAAAKADRFVLDEGEARSATDRLVLANRRLLQDYEQQHVKVWRELLLDVTVVPAKSDEERAKIVKLLATEPCPLRQLLDLVRESTVAMKATEGAAPAPQSELANKTFGSLGAFGGPAADAPLAQYHQALREASDKLASQDRSGLKAAEQKTRELLWKLDATGQELVGPVLLGVLGAK